MTLNPVCENVETAQGVPLTVTGVAQVKIMKNADLLQTASEQFLGKKEHEIKSTVLQTLEGHLRAILGKPDVYSSKKKTIKSIHRSSSPNSNSFPNSFKKSCAIVQFLSTGIDA